MKPETVFVALTLASCHSTSQASPREIESVAPDLVLTFEYETPAFRVSAHRFNVHDHFEVVVQRPGQALRGCTGDKAFDDNIAGFEALTSKHVLPDEQAAEPKSNRTHHRLRFATEPPLDAFDEVLSPLPSGALSIVRDGTTHELTLTTAAVERLAKSCQ